MKNIPEEVNELVKEIDMLDLRYDHPDLRGLELKVFLIGDFIFRFGHLHTIVCSIRGTFNGLNEQKSTIEYLDRRFSENFNSVTKELSKCGASAFLESYVIDHKDAVIEFRHDISHGTFGNYKPTGEWGIFRPRRQHSKFSEGFKAVSEQDLIVKCRQILKLQHLFAIVYACVSGGNYSFEYQKFGAKAQRAEIISGSLTTTII